MDERDAKTDALRRCRTARKVVGMGCVRNGVFLLKRWSREKGVDHYAVGLAGNAAWRAGFTQPTTVQLLPTGIWVEAWTERDRWEVLIQASDEQAAIGRLIARLEATYALLSSNCEHFAREVVTGVRESRQVQGAVLIGVLAAIVIAGR
jgi:hypothetical protein